MHATLAWVNHSDQLRSFFGWRFQGIGSIFLQAHQCLCCGKPLRYTKGPCAWLCAGLQKPGVFGRHGELIG